MIHNFSTTRRHVLALEYPVERVALRACAAVLVVLLFSYLSFVTASVLHVIARKDAMAQSVRMTGAISDLEHRYFELSQSVTPEAAQKFGLSALPRSYVYAPGATAFNTIGNTEAAAHHEI